MGKFSKKIIAFLVAILMVAIPNVASSAELEVEHDPALLNALLRDVFIVSEGEYDGIGSPKVRAVLSDSKFNAFVKNMFEKALNDEKNISATNYDETNIRFYDELFKNKKQFKSDQEMLAFLNGLFKKGRIAVIGGNALINVIGSNTAPVLAKTLGGIAAIMLALKVGQDWWNNGNPSKVIADNAHDIGLALSFLGSVAIGGPFPILASAGIILHKFTPIAHDFLAYDGYSSTVEKLFNNFSKYSVTYISEGGKFSFKFKEKKPVKKEFVGPVDQSRFLPQNLRPEVFTGYDQALKSEVEYLRPFPLTFEDFVGYEQTWSKSEFYLDWNDINQFDRVLKYMFTKYVNEPEKVTAAIEKFLDDYATLFWRLPSKLRLYYMQDSFYPFKIEQYSVPTKAEQELYIQNSNFAAKNAA